MTKTLRESSCAMYNGTHLAGMLEDYKGTIYEETHEMSKEMGSYSADKLLKACETQNARLR